MTSKRGALVELSAKHCHPYKAGTPALGLDQAVALQAHVPGWKLRPEADGLSRLFSFDDYPGALAFLNAVAAIAIAEDHHPDMTLQYKMVRVSFSTHSVGGLSENDFICAAKVDQLYL
jgi:4a-hydroxytetrahydrobiopterin dehydratase